MGRKRSSVEVRNQLFSPSMDSPTAASSSNTGAPRRKKQRTAQLQLDTLVGASDLLSLSTPVGAVASFVKAVCRRVFPRRVVWGSRHNHNVFMAGLENYVKLGRQETLQLGQIAARMKLQSVPWLAVLEERNHSRHAYFEKELPHKSDEPEPMEIDSQHTLCSSTASVDSPGPGAKTPIIPTDESVNLVASSSAKLKPEHSDQRRSSMRLPSVAQQQLFYTFLQWVYAEVVNSLIAVCFYVTEAEGRGAEVLYYRKPLWARIVRLGKQQLVQNFVPVSDF